MIETFFEFESIEEIRTKFGKIEGVISNFEMAEFEYLLKNERFKHIFSDEMIKKLDKMIIVLILIGCLIEVQHHYLTQSSGRMPING